MKDNIIQKLIALRSKKIDSIELILNVLSITKSEDINEVLNVYQKILKKEISLVEIVCGFEISKEQKRELEKKLTQKFNPKELVFTYTLNSDVIGGIQIKIDDMLLDYSATEFIK